MESSLIIAVRGGDLLLVRELLDQGADIHTRNDLALIVAGSNGHLNIVRELLNRGANIHARDDQILIAAARDGDLDMVRELLNRGVDIHAQGDRALFLAAHFGHESVVEELLVEGASINRLSPELETQYQHLVPKILTVQEYYQIEPDVDRIRDLSSRDDEFILFVRNKAYILL